MSRLLHLCGWVQVCCMCVAVRCSVCCSSLQSVLQCTYNEEASALLGAHLFNRKCCHVKGKKITRDFLFCPCKLESAFVVEIPNPTLTIYQ